MGLPRLCVTLYHSVSAYITRQYKLLLLSMNDSERSSTLHGISEFRMLEPTDLLLEEGI